LTCPKFFNAGIFSNDKFLVWYYWY
jgi:hypothetical protein